MKRVIGVDLGGTKINAGVVDDTGKICNNIILETLAGQGRDVVIKRIVEAVQSIMEDDIIGIGITSPGFINSDDGIVEFAGNIKGWTGLNMHETFSECFPGKVLRIENDANMAALCEKWVGSGKDLKSFVMLTLGTGLGGAIYHEAMGLWLGANYQGAELGHMVLYPNGRACNCGQLGCAEKYIAGSALSINYEELTNKILDGHEIISKIESDEYAKDALDKFVDDLAIFLVSIKNCHDPEGIILGGGFINSRDKWWKLLLDKFNEKCNRPEGIKILPAKFLNDSGIIGAAKSVLDVIDRQGS